MQTPKARSNSSEAPQKISPLAVRQLKTTTLESTPASSSNQTRTPKDRSPKVTERRSPRSPASELQRKRPNRFSELESQISQLQEDLKKVKDQLSSSESCKKRAQQDAEESKKQLLAVSSKLEESQKQLLELSASEEAHIIELQKISQARDRAWQSELEAVQKQHSVDCLTLTSAVNEIQQLKLQLEVVAESEAAQIKHAESADAELQSLKENLAETLSLVEDMKNQLRDCKESEAQAQGLIGETLLQLETAKKTVETLRLDGIKAKEAYNSIASDLDKSRTHVNLLEGLVNKLEVDFTNAGTNSCKIPGADRKLEWDITEDDEMRKAMQLEGELISVNTELGQLRTALEMAEIGYHEGQIQSIVQIRSAKELVDQINSTLSQREAELEAELNKAKVDIEELKANLMDKEAELQGISEENEGLHLKLEKGLACPRQYELEKELKKSIEDVEDLKENLMDKETELQSISEENEILKLEIRRKEMDKGKMNDHIVEEVEAARAAEQEALMKLGYMTEEADKSNRRAAMVAEQLEAAQVATSEMEAELRKLKVQSDQWRKAAEAAAAMLSTGNKKTMERTESLDSSYNPMTGKISSLYSEDIDDDMLKKRNGNVLKKIGVLWKKPQK